MDSLHFIKKMIGKGKIRKSFDEFEKIIKDSDGIDPKNKERILNLLTRFKSVVENSEFEFLSGQITREERDVTVNRVTNSILKEIDDLEKMSYATPEIIDYEETISSFYKLIVFALFVTVALGRFVLLPRRVYSVSYLLLAVLLVVVVSSYLVIIYLRIRAKSPGSKFFRTVVFGVLIGSIFHYGPRGMAIYVLGNSMQAHANSRYHSGMWAKAMEIYQMEKFVLTKTSRDNIAEMQLLLNQAGYYLDEIDGNPDKRIIKALKELQSDYELKPDGFVGRYTSNALYSLIYAEELMIPFGTKDLAIINSHIRDFQEENEISSDGVIGRQTLWLLKSLREN